MARRFLLTLLLASFALGSTAAADPPYENSHESVFIGCHAVTPEGTVLIEATGGGDGETFIGVWAPGADPAVDAPVLATFDPIRTVQDDRRLSGEGVVYDVATGEIAGDASYRVEVFDVDSTRIRERERAGDRLIKVRGTRYVVDGIGSVSLPGIEAALEDCAGTSTSVQSWGNSPHNIQGSGRFAIIECTVVHPDGHTLLVYGDDLNLNAEVYAPGSEQQVLFAFGHDDFGNMLDNEGIHQELRVHDGVTGEYLGDTVSALTAADVGKPQPIDQRFQNGRQTLRVQDAVLAGTMSFPNGQTFDLTGCGISEFDSSLHVSFLPERDSLGAVPGNDAPAGASPIRLGTTARQQTGGAAQAPEVDTACNGKPGVDGPTGKTVWYSVTASAASLTIDTAGSDFDTVVSVYRQDAAGLTEVACIDDVAVHRFVDSPQARLTVPTAPGGRYLVQVGGFNGEYGRLAVSAK